MKSKLLPSANAAELREKAEQIVYSKLPETESTLGDLNDKKCLHELQIHKIELEMQNEELRRSLAELREHEEHLCNIIKE